MRGDAGSLRLGMFAWYGYDRSFRERIRLIAEAGFQSACFWLSIDEDYIAKGWSNQLPYIFREYNLELENAHIPYDHCNDIWSRDSSAREALLRDYCNAVEFCSRHSVPMMVMHITRGTKPPPPYPHGLELLMQLTERAGRLGVRIAIENTASNEHIDYILGKIDSPHLGLCYDTSHDFLRGEPFCGLLRKWGHRLFATHVSDNDGLKDCHWIIGTGKVDWHTFVDSFPKSSYTGVLSCEVLPSDNEPVVEFVKSAHDQLKRLSRRIEERR